MANDFLQFGTGGGANVISQAAYAGLAARPTGFQSGIARSDEVNKVIRQSSVIAAMVAQFIEDASGDSMLDNGSGTSTYVNLLQKALMRARGTFTVFLSGSGNYTVPADVWKIKVRAIGGGGAGGGGNSSGYCGAGGGAGCYGEVFLAVTPGDIIAYSVGAGGAGGAGGVNANDGGNTTFGTLVAGGGQGARDTGSSWAGGSGSNIATNFSFAGAGGDGEDGLPAASATVRGGHGGASYFGGGGRAAVGTGDAGVSHGTGGGGSYGTVTGNGGAGANGVIIIEY